MTAVALLWFIPVAGLTFALWWAHRMSHPNPGNTFATVARYRRFQEVMADNAGMQQPRRCSACGTTTTAEAHGGEITIPASRTPAVIRAKRMV